MKTILTINSGSSSIKASLFDTDGTRSDFRYEHLRDHAPAFEVLMRDLHGHQPDLVAHRFVHGGNINDAARRVDDAEETRLKRIEHLAPLHLPGNLLGLALCRKHFKVPQIACFDTAFHASLPELSYRLPIPVSAGLRRYGFHGLNYAYIASCLPDLLGTRATGKIVIAHLGSGASLCMLQNLTSVDTTMGYTPAGGIVMGTRSGDLDPGIMLELASRHNTTELRDIVFHKMGLLALSDGLSSEMSDLLASDTIQAGFAVDYFCREVSGAIGRLAAKAGGIDALVFTGGIGEHAALVRQKICSPLAFMGVDIDASQNAGNSPTIGRTGSKPVLIVAADEERMMQRLSLSLQAN